MKEQLGYFNVWVRKELLNRGMKKDFMTDNMRPVNNDERISDDRYKEIKALLSSFKTQRDKVIKERKSFLNIFRRSPSPTV